jgi:hypothetical protein
LGVRDDITADACTAGQLKFKAEIEEARASWRAGAKQPGDAQ